MERALGLVEFEMLRTLLVGLLLAHLSLIHVVSSLACEVSDLVGHFSGCKLRRFNFIIRSHYFSANYQFSVLAILHLV